MFKMRAVGKHLLLVVMVAGVVGCDRVTKDLATDTLAGQAAQSYFFDVVRLSYAENTGSFLSLGAELPESVRFLLFVVAAGFALVLLAAYAIRGRWTGARLWGLALVIAGGASNLVDRIADGRVVDFLNVGFGPIRTGIFNVADMALLAGVAILLLSEYGRGRRRASPAQRPH
jgi:signal peptidase II